jgi:hypothetical protein
MRWSRVVDVPLNVQRWDGNPDARDVGPGLNQNVMEQVRHAKQQLELTRQYPGRERERPKAKIIKFEP